MSGQIQEKLKKLFIGIGKERSSVLILCTEVANTFSDALSVQILCK